MYKRETVLENKMHKVLWDVEIQIDHWMVARGLGLMITNKKNHRKVGFAVTEYHSVKIKESGKSTKYLNLDRELREL